MGARNGRRLPSRLPLSGLRLPLRQPIPAGQRQVQNAAMATDMCLCVRSCPHSHSKKVPRNSCQRTFSFDPRVESRYAYKTPRAVDDTRRIVGTLGQHRNALWSNARTHGFRTSRTSDVR